MGSTPIKNTPCYDKLSNEAQALIDKAVAHLYQQIKESEIDLIPSDHVFSVIEAISQWALASENKRWIHTEKTRPTRPIESINEWWRLPKRDPNVYVNDEYFVR